ncbi:hypothetical protein [Bradyrhizobium sp. WSM3983]|uniref:hypothetical protein n=1 Tax=Bradyrhizobium sp. WSM3983 TaxID=1038867 RepID=UPI00042A0EC1|nr:hypothetical protein [Bradyrhizobium sp. WSM3983]
MSKAKTFVEYALQGFYVQARRSTDKRFFSISKAGMHKALGTSRVGYAQREEMRSTCQRLGIGMSELPDKFIFFDPEQLASDEYDMTAKAATLKKLTDEFDRLKRSEADREWAERFEEET